MFEFGEERMYVLEMAYLKYNHSMCIHEFMNSQHVYSCIHLAEMFTDTNTTKSSSKLKFYFLLLMLENNIIRSWSLLQILNVL